MLNKNHTAEIRTCERIKFDQALYILTMYEKKIRTEIKPDDNKPIDAQKEYDEKIVHSWNGKWKIDLTKPLLNCVTSISPRVLLSINQNEEDMREPDDSDRYNSVMLQFIRRMRAEHEDESNFKLTEVDVGQAGATHEKFLPFASRACKNFLAAIESMCQGMRNSIQQNGSNLELEENDDNYCFQIGGRIEEIEEVTKNTASNYINEHLMKFVTSCMNAFDNIKQSEHGSTLVAAQPKLDEFTYILHPMFMSIYGSLLREKEQQKIKGENRDMQQIREPFKNFFAANTSSLSKFVFINLDGYESQFNLQFARCFRKNMLYISFPKEDIHSANDMNSIYEQRLYKKIMYGWEKNKMKYDPNAASMDSEADKADYMYFITRNIENYFSNVENVLYKSDGGLEDLNRNMFVFPLRLNTLNENFNNLVAEDEDDTVDVYESYAILQIFKYFLVNQIKEFGPTCIIVSHSGRLHIDDNHFVQIMQELTKLSNYKVVYFPNLTTRFCPHQKKGIDHEINISNIDYLIREHQQQSEQDTSEANISFDFFNKIARFLKVCSGTHSLVKNFEEEDLLAKNRNLNVLRRINKLMEVLGNEYENIERMRFKSTEIDLIPKLYQKDAEKIMKAFQKLVPLFYIELYQLVESIFTACLLPPDKKVQLELLKYEIDPGTISRNHVILDLIDYIKGKIMVRNVSNQNDRQSIVFEKIRKYLLCQKEKHFLEIIEQKYEDSVLLHFKTASNHEIFDTIQEGKPNLSGLVDVSFSNPHKDIKDCMHIFESTQILYKLDQTEGNGSIPLLIMNHLPLERKNVSKFDNYCAFLSRDVLGKLSAKVTEQGIQKIYEEKRIKPYLIKFIDENNREMVEGKFCFRVEWNYCESDEYMLLYWPQLFNFVDAVAHKLQNRTYEPPILNQFFIARKQVKNDVVYFYKTHVPEDVAPRTGCTAYSHRNLIYLFGGFYEREKNYLSLQRDVTLVNLEPYDHGAQNRKLQIINVKNQLYEPITVENEQHRRQNSYVRPRREYQFYNIEDLDPQHEAEHNVRQVVMVGGVGQNFIHPFSLLTYYYYLLRFEETTGKLLSLKKCLTYNRSIPVNIRRPSKNMGIIKTPIRNKNESNGKAIITKPQLTEPHSYARFRVVYKIEGDQFKYKFQYVFSEKDCKLLKEELRKYEEEKYEVTELSSIRMEKIDGMNHMFMIEKYGSKQIVHLRLEIDATNDQKEQEFKLTHDSISYLNIINGNYICAIVKHPIFTNDTSLLVECKVKNIENENLSEDEAAYITLKPVHNELRGDLTLHILEASNVNLIYVLHGHRLYNSDHIYEYQITHNRKSGLKTVSEIKPKKMPEIVGKKSVLSSCCSTFFYKKVEIKNEIICESYLSFEEDKYIVTRVDQYFDPSDTSSMSWVLREPIVRYIFYLGTPKTPVSLDRVTFLEFYRQDQVRIMVVLYNRRKYIIRIDDSQHRAPTQDILIMLEPATEVSIRGLQEQEFERGSILIKKPQQYVDRGYEPARE